MAQRSEFEPEGKPVPIDWQVPEDLPIHFVNNLTIQRLQHEFILTFYQTLPPVLLGPLSERKLEETETVPAKAVARIALAAGQLPGFIRAMRDNLERHRPDLAEQLEEEDE